MRVSRNAQARPKARQAGGEGIQAWWAEWFACSGTHRTGENAAQTPPSTPHMHEQQCAHNRPPCTARRQTDRQTDRQTGRKRAGNAHVTQPQNTAHQSKMRSRISNVFFFSNRKHTKKANKSRYSIQSLSNNPLQASAAVSTPTNCAISRPFTLRGLLGRTGREPVKAPRLWQLLKPAAAPCSDHGQWPWLAGHHSVSRCAACQTAPSARPPATDSQFPAAVCWSENGWTRNQLATNVKPGEKSLESYLDGTASLAAVAGLAVGSSSSSIHN